MLVREICLRLLALLLLLVVGCQSGGVGGGSGGGAAAERKDEAPISVTTRRLSEPRPLMLHVARVDLRARGVEVVSVVSPDPDGSGPAVAQLIQPVTMFNNAGLQLAVNANAFSVVPIAGSDVKLGYVDWAPARYHGLSAFEGEIISKAQSRFVSLWTDRKGRVRIGMPGKDDRVYSGVAGFGWLVREGKVVVPASDKVQHPRTAAGVSADGRWLWLVVVDGRDPGVSEGMNLYELAGVMRDLGASEALNLDGGGSSVMLQRDTAVQSTGVRVVNKPSTRIGGQSVMRPVPNLLGVRVLGARGR